VGDAFLGFAFAAEGNEGFTFKVEKILLAHKLRGSERASGENVAELARH
jgi:hypothetical protein